MDPPEWKQAGLRWLGSAGDRLLVHPVEDVVQGYGVLRDEVILMVSQQEAGPEVHLRRIGVWV